MKYQDVPALNIPCAIDSPFFKTLQTRDISASKNLNMSTDDIFERKKNDRFRILVANNGIASLKFIRSIRFELYKNFRDDHHIEFVALATKEDIEGHAEYIKLSDEIIKIPSGPSQFNFGNVELIVQIAQEASVQAVWPGWGHASEDPKLPELLTQLNILFLGPSSDSMWLLGDKISSNIIAQSLSIPVLPWSGDGVKMQPDLGGKFKIVPSEVYQECTIHHSEEISKHLLSIGFPMMLKASNGGGGKGIRKVYQESECDKFFKQIISEVKNSEIFAIKMLSKSRHIEIQLLGDKYGNIISLFSRDCSVQRRHQKVIEEAPALICPKEIIDKMEKDAVKLAKSVDYVGLGTVEYLYNPETNNYYFLELNARLQVEHTCTELITITNLPWCQLQIALGKRISEIQNLQPFFGESTIIPKYHVISVRILAECADEGFCPNKGYIEQIKFLGGKNVFGYFSIYSDGKIYDNADSQYGHIFSCADNREEARKQLIVALKELSIHGDIRTNSDFLVSLLENEIYISNIHHIEWLDSIISLSSFIKKIEASTVVICGACIIAHFKYSLLYDGYKKSLQKGLFPKCNLISEPLKIFFVYQNKKYLFYVSRTSENSYFLKINNSIFYTDYFTISNKGILVSLNHKLYSCFLTDEIDKYVLIIDSNTCLLYKDLDPSLLRSSTCGKLIKILVPDGSYINKGVEYAEVEVMKMVMSLVSSDSGRIHFQKSVGSHLDNGSVIAKLTLDDTQKLNNISEFQGELPICSEIKILPNIIQAVFTPHSNHDSDIGIHEFFAKNQNIFNVSFKNLINVMDGYCIPEPYFIKNVKQDLNNVTTYLSHSHFTLSHLKSSLDRTKNFLPDHIYKSISRLIYHYSVNVSSLLYELPVEEIHSILVTHLMVIDDIDKREVFTSNISELLEIVKKLKNGPKSYKITKLLDLLQHYIDVEKYFVSTNFENCVHFMLSSNMSLDEILKAINSHSKLKFKNILALMIIDVVSDITKHFCGLVEEVKDIMMKLSNFPSSSHLKVPLRAKQFLNSATRPSIELRRNQLESIFLSIITGPSNFTHNTFKEIIHSDGVLYDLLPYFFYSPNSQIQSIALEVYIRRAYISHQLVCIHHDRIHDIPFVKFFYLTKSDTQKSHNSLIKTNSCNGSDLIMIDINQPIENLNLGIFLCFNSFESFITNFSSCLTHIKVSSSDEFHNNIRSLDVKFNQEKGKTIINICARVPGSCTDMQDSYAKQCDKVIKNHMKELEKFMISRVTIIITNSSGEFPLFYTYDSEKEFQENKLFRNIEPAEECMLEIQKMSNFNLECIPCEHSSIHIYYGINKFENACFNDQRYFIRTIVRNIGLISVEPSFEYLVKASEIRLLEALDQLAIITSKLNKPGSYNHLFFNFISCIVIDPSKTVECLRVIVLKHRDSLLKYNIYQAEMKMTVLLQEDGKPISLRIIAEKESGFHLNLTLYKEVYDSKSKCIVFESFEGYLGNLSDQTIDTPYPPLSKLEYKRICAHSIGTTYVYDYPNLFLQSINIGFAKLFDSDFNEPPKCNYKELVMENEESYNLIEIQRELACNSIGIVCWEFYLSNLPYDINCQFIVVATDITFKNGSFSQAEARFFTAACLRANKKQIPFIFCCCSNGARIGMADEIRNFYKVRWKDLDNYEKGIEYLYLEETDYDNLKFQNAINVEKIIENGKIIYKIVDIFGEVDGIGVENLKGSGLVAGQMSKLYDSTFTISLVTGRAVGIGAYLVRLGRRVVQVENSTIILTGAETLNRVLGNNVYNSHEQLGGINVMYSNGVSQIVAKDDLDGIRKILKWLSYYLQNNIHMSKHFKLKYVDKIEEISQETDPKKIVFGYWLKGKYFQGFFDEKSVFEINSRWSSTVITGRAKLGGNPVSFILNDINTVKTIIPADPADQNDTPKENISIGQVLSPDSSFKFSQSIDDSNREKLPLFIFANFRGFSAGMKDMYNQVLKFGAMIVDSLRKYNYPVFIYIMPKGELRGGSWAVLDSSINPRMIEIYSSENSSANVLEPSGLIAVKYRKNEIIKTIKRIENIEDNVLDNFASETFDQYGKVIELFASLHDTPARMILKNVIKAIIPWNESRKLLLCRLRRRLFEENIRKEFENIDKSITDEVFKKMIISWFSEFNSDTQYNSISDIQATSWLEEILIKNPEFYEGKIKEMKYEIALKSIKNILFNQPDLLDYVKNFTVNL